MKLAMWVFMLVCNLLAPAIMICFGRLFRTDPPRELSSGFGYRTRRSMKNQDTWDFAQRYMGELWWKTGWGLLAFAMLGQALTLLSPTTWSMFLWSFAPMTVEIVVGLFSTLIPIEQALKQNFDENGNRL